MSSLLAARQRPSWALNGGRGRAAARQPAPAPAALLNFNFPSLPSLAPARGGPAERPLEKATVRMGPFSVAPMGFGTWSWVSKRRRR